MTRNLADAPERASDESEEAVPIDEAEQIPPADGRGQVVLLGDSADAPTGRWSRLAGAVRRPWVLAVVVLLVAGAALASWKLAQDDGLPEGVAFRIGDTDVTTADVDSRVEALQALYGVQVPESAEGRDTFRRDAAKSMAVQIMLEQEAAGRGIVVADKEVSDTLRTLIEQRYPDGGRAAFVDALGEMGATEAQVRDEIRNQLLVSRLFDDVVGDVSVDDAEVREAFEDRRQELGTPARRVVRNIVVADRAAAQQVLAALRDGASFEAAARSYSLDQATRDSGGLLGPVAARDLEPGYADAAFDATAGELFGPVRTQHGWNVGRVDRVLRPVPASFPEVRDALRQTLVAEQSLEAWREWLGDVIRRHDVEYADAYRPADPDAVPDIDEAQLTEQPGSPGER